jgi:glutamate synthase domain-containing protein 2
LRKVFFVGSFLIFSMIGCASLFWPRILWSLILVLPVFMVGMQNALQTKRAILRNFPIIGIFRYFLEAIRPEIQQYFVESETDGAPIPREIRSVVYQRAKQQTDTLPFGTQRDVYAEGYEWISHSLAPKHVDPLKLRINIGGPDCKKPYSASLFNISAMSYGALSKNAVLALNGGAKLGDFYHNTGEGGVSPYHLSEGGDLVWQVGTGYFGCRTSNGNFCPEIFQKMAQKENIKMIELKLSQGAKPSHGGILPAAKITPEIVEIRKIEPGKDVVSPPAHKAFSNPIGLLHFIQKLRELSGGKPIGFKLCVGQPSEFIAICKAMVETNIMPDFITVDGGEGGTGAAPLEFSNNVGAPLEEGLSFVHNILCGFDLRKHIRIIASGKILTGFNIFSRIALGADACNAARGMMLAIGCIQARRCNTNHCPTGVATSNPDLVNGLVPSDKKVRVYNYQKHTLKAFAELLGASGLTQAYQVQKEHVSRRCSNQSVKTYAELFLSVKPGLFFQKSATHQYQTDFDKASAQYFQREVNHETDIKSAS